MTKKVFRSTLLVALLVVAASLALIMYSLYGYLIEVQTGQMKTQAELAAEGTSRDGLDYLEALDARDYRLTWIAADGKVIYDSEADAATMENHAQREEVKESYAEGYGESVRYSDTLMEKMIYVAVKLDDGSVLRVSTEQKSAFGVLVGMFQPIALVVIVAIVLSLILSSLVSRKITDPINNLDLDDPLRNDVYEEITPLLRRLDMQQKALKKQELALKRQKNEFATATSNMSEGLILVNSRREVLTMNNAAKKILGVTTVKPSTPVLTLCREGDMPRVIEEAEKGRHAVGRLTLGGREYDVDASPVISDDEIRGAAIVFFDVTEKNKSEQIRREFTANVSHELKTPLQTISGASELLANGLVRKGDEQKFYDQIYKESQHLIGLIDDIIGLSKLDEGVSPQKFERIDLYDGAQSTASRLSDSAEKAGVEVSVTGSHAEIEGLDNLVSEIIYNLCDNAIKYNRQGGSVNIDVSKEDGRVVLTVKDNGQGIAPSVLPRVFERFYRGDKSHSGSQGAPGGTGLGMSIVKHSAEILGGEISIESELGEGTEVRVTFPDPDTQPA